jgi:hypothetical protein
MSSRRAHILALYAALLLLVLPMLSGNAPAYGQNRQVSLELVLLVDVSASVDDEEFHLQARGLASAFASPRVLNAISTMPAGGMVVCIVQWADHENQRVSVDWMLLQSRQDALQLSDRLRSIPRLIFGGHTALGDALAFGLNKIQTNHYEGVRRVIDLSGDGRSNDGRSLYRTRKEVLEHGITINGLAILNELPLLASYFRDQLIGGEGAFVETASDYTDFAQAMSRKLEREIRAVPLAGNAAPGSFETDRAETGTLFSNLVARHDPLPSDLATLEKALTRQ